MDNNSFTKPTCREPKTIRIRGARPKKSPNPQISSTSTIEGTFIPLSGPNASSSQEIIWNAPQFVNPHFQEEEEDDNDEDDEEQGELIAITDLEVDETPPLLLLFPDLQRDDRLNKTMSTTELTKLLVGKKADFSLLKPSRKLNPLQVCC